MIQIRALNAGNPMGNTYSRANCHDLGPPKWQGTLDSGSGNWLKPLLTRMTKSEGFYI